jgi:hypothetical protein
VGDLRRGDAGSVGVREHVAGRELGAETVANQFLSAHHVDIAESIAAARAALLADRRTTSP